jgi:hypothetical protein
MPSQSAHRFCPAQLDFRTTTKPKKTKSLGFTNSGKRWDGSSFVGLKALRKSALHRDVIVYE